MDENVEHNAIRYMPNLKNYPNGFDGEFNPFFS